MYAKFREELSDREQEVLRLMALGYRNEDIANTFYLTLNTVKFHVRGILWKMNAKNRAHAVALGYEKGILLLNGRLF